MKIFNLRLLLLGAVMIMGFTMSSCEKERMENSSYGAIEGNVRVRTEGTPLEEVTITTNPASEAPVSNKDGNFSIGKVPVGKISVAAKKNGYKTVNLDIAIRAGETNNLNIILEKSSSTYDIEIYGPSPKDAAEQIPLSVELKWSVKKKKDLDIIYKLCVFKAGSNGEVLNEGNITDTSFTVNDLEFETTYFWYVQSYVDGELQESSPTWRFTTKDVSHLPVAFARLEEEKYHIYLSDTGGSNLYRIPGNSSASDWNPRFNHAGNSIAFVSSRNHQPKLFRSNGVGGSAEQVSSIPILGYNNYGDGFCWSPDDRYFLICSYDKLYRIDRDGANPTIIAVAPAGRNFKYCDWNDITNKILVQTTGENVYHSEIYIMDVDGSNMELIIDNEPGMLDYPSFSIDGKDILYTYDTDGFENSAGRQLNANVYLIDVATKVKSMLYTTKTAGTNDLYPRFSPNGAWIIMINIDNSGVGNPNIHGYNFMKFGINTGTTRTGGTTLESRKWIENGTHPDWRP